MTAIAEVIESGGFQTVKLPQGFRIAASSVAVRREGDVLVLEPLPPATWPRDFFDRIRIDDPDFERPSQGEVPAVPAITPSE
jgi:virulence-associated protein VagC